jgi:hypothetical protein
MVPVEDTVCVLEKAPGAVPEETTEEVQQETARILKDLYKTQGNLNGAERRSLWALKVSEEITVNYNH